MWSCVEHCFRQKHVLLAEVTQWSHGFTEPPYIINFLLQMDDCMQHFTTVTIDFGVEVSLPLLLLVKVHDLYYYTVWLVT